jgi:hypothetical protein
MPLVTSEVVMKAKQSLKWVNVLLTVAVVGVLLGCGGDPAHPPPGTLEAKMEGTWEAEPLLPPASDTGLRHTTRIIRISFFADGNCRHGVHTSADYTEQPQLKDVTKPTPKETYANMGNFNYDGLTATSDVPQKDGSVWVLRLDANDPQVMYVTWKQADGTKRLDEVPFRKSR